MMKRQCDASVRIAARALLVLVVTPRVGNSAAPLPLISTRLGGPGAASIGRRFAAQQSPTDADRLIEEADRLRSEGRYPEAIERWERALKIFDNTLGP